MIQPTETHKPTRYRLAFILAVLMGICISLLFAGVSGFFRLRKAESEARQLQALNESLTGELKTVKNQNGTLTAGRVAIQGRNKEFLKIIAGQNSRISELQSIIKQNPKNTQLAAVIRTETKNRYKVPTVPGLQPDTGQITTVCPPPPIYTAAVQTEFEKITVIARPDSVLIDSEHYETGEIKQVNEKQDGFLKPRRPVVYYTSKNPKTKVTDVNPYIVEQPKGSKAGAFLKGAGAGAAVVILLKFLAG